MTPELPSSSKPLQGVMIRRAATDEIEAIRDAVWELAKISPAAAHWSRATFYPYIANDSGSGALQAKALFLAIANPEEGAKAGPGVDPAMVARIVGFAAFSAIMTIGAGESTLENMAVDPAWQRNGIGKRLMAAGMLWCRAHAAGTVFLEVRASNRAAIALYERTGFVTIGNRPGYYREPAEDGIQMRKVLDPVAHTG